MVATSCYEGVFGDGNRPRNEGLQTRKQQPENWMRGSNASRNNLKIKGEGSHNKLIIEGWVLVLENRRFVIKIPVSVVKPPLRLFNGLAGDKTVASDINRVCLVMKRLGFGMRLRVLARFGLICDGTSSICGYNLYQLEVG